MAAGSGSLGAASSELLSRPRGAVGSGAAAVESAAVSVVVRVVRVVRVGALVRWRVGIVVRFVIVIRVPVCASASRVCPVCVPAPPVSFYRYPPVSFYRYTTGTGMYRIL